MVVKLVVLKGKAKGREIPLPSSQFLIGRGASCHLRPHSELVSKLHCAIARKPGGKVVIRDLKSRNCTYLNDEPVKGSARARDGDVLAIGPLQFQFAISADESGSSLQSVREENIHWLLEEQDSRDVDSSADTAIIEIPPHLLDENRSNGDISETQSDNRLSVGKYLRDYYATKKNGKEKVSTFPVDVHKDQLLFVDQLLNRMVRNEPDISRDSIVRLVIDAVAQMGLDLETIKSPEDLKQVLKNLNR